MESVSGFSPTSRTREFRNSRKRCANGQKLHMATEAYLNTVPNKRDEFPFNEKFPTVKDGQETSTTPTISERRKALFEPLEPANARRYSDEPPVPPDFDAACYPKGWLIGKKRKLVNVDVVESMRRIAVQEMNRKDREINGLNEQLEEDAKIVEHLQLQLLQERSKCADIERENSVLQNQVSMLMNMLQDAEGVDDDDDDEAQDS